MSEEKSVETLMSQINIDFEFFFIAILSTSKSANWWSDGWTAKFEVLNFVCLDRPGQNRLKDTTF